MRQKYFFVVQSKVSVFTPNSTYTCHNNTPEDPLIVTTLYLEGVSGVAIKNSQGQFAQSAVIDDDENQQKLLRTIITDKKQSAESMTIVDTLQDGNIDRWVNSSGTLNVTRVDVSKSLYQVNFKIQFVWTYYFLWSHL